jgi:choline dehydrogenase-like flavoprotein
MYDCSVFPTIVTGNTNAAAIMTGERVAEFIYKEWAL